MNSNSKRVLSGTIIILLYYAGCIAFTHWAFETAWMDDFFDKHFRDTDEGLFLACLFAIFISLILYVVPFFTYILWKRKTSKVVTQNIEKPITNERLVFKPSLTKAEILSLLAIDIAICITLFLTTATHWITIVGLLLIVVIPQVINYFLVIAPAKRNTYTIDGNIFQIREYNVKGLKTNLDIPLSTIESVQLNQYNLTQSSLVIRVEGKDLALAATNCTEEIYKALKARI